MKLITKLKCSAALSLAFSMAAGAAVAQTAGSATLDSITVTAQKREQSIQDVPIAIAAFDSEQLRELGATSLESVAYFVPGVHLDDARGSGQPTWVIRGVGLGDFNSNNTPTAAIFYDETYLVSSAMGAVGLYDLERVEVLKGPQGGLYGRNTTGGAVRIVSAKPDTQERDAYLQASYGRWGRYKVEGAATVPIIEDRLAVRVSGLTDQGGGWQDSLTTPFDDEHGDRGFWAFRGQVLYTPTSELEILFKADVGADTSETTLGRSNGVYDPNTGDFCSALRAGMRDDNNCIGLHNLLGDPLLASDQTDNGTVVLSNPINELDNSWNGFTLNVDYDLGFANLVSITNYIDFDYVQFFDFDATPLELVSSRDDLPDTDSDIEQWSQELRLVSSGSGPFTWLIGGVYAEDTTQTIQNFGLADLEPVAGINSISADFFQKTTSWAVYAQFGYDILDTVNINGSFRYTDEDKEIDYVSRAAATGLGSFDLIAPVMFQATLDIPWSGHLGVDWRVRDNALLYAKYARAIKSGGFFGAATANGDDVSPYDQETSDAYEIGLKSNPTDDLQVNIAAYYYDYRDVQGLGGTAAATGAVTQQLSNLGDAEHYGVEIDALWTPSQVPGFSLQLAGNWLDAEIVSSNFSGLTQDFVPVSFDGIARDFAPEFSFSVNARQEKEITDRLLASFQAVYTWRDQQRPPESQLSILDFGLFRQDAYGLLNLRASLADTESGWEIAVLGENVTNEAFVTRATGDDGGSYLDLIGRPASWTIQLRHDF